MSPYKALLILQSKELSLRCINSGLSVVGGGGVGDWIRSPHHDFVSLHQGLVPHKNFQKTIRKTISYCLKIPPPLVNLPEKTLKS